MCAFLSHYQALEVRLDKHRCISVVAAVHVHLESSHALSIAYLFACYLRQALDVTEIVHLQLYTRITTEFVRRSPVSDVRSGM